LEIMGALNEQSAVRSLELGDVRLTYVVDGAMGMRPDGFFPGIPAEYWTEQPGALDEYGLVAMSAGGLLVERDGRRCLIDAGLGPVRGPVAVAGEPIGVADCGALPATLAALGLAPADIEALAFTHLHVDHTGWAFTPDDSGVPRRFFPAARYLVAEQEWAPHARGELVPGAPARSALIEPLAGAHTALSDGEEVFPGVRALVTPGHSPGHTSFVISTGAERVIAFGDVFHVPGQVAHPDWPSLPDVDHEGVLAARTRLVAELEHPGTIGFACHFGDQAFGRVVRDGGLLRWEPVPAKALLPAPRQSPAPQ
jgi:glyoxylase-like metal-dependent hydrolase (beta-lactamase superfamily II)